MREGAAILIVDDERPVLMTLEAVLGRHGYRVNVASTAAAGRDRFAKEQIDLVLLDLGLPDGSGLDLLKEFKAQKPAVEVLVLTGQDSLSNAIESIKLGAFHFIGKPYAMEELLSLIHRALQTRRMVEETDQLRAEKERLTERLAAVESKLQPVFQSRRMAEIRELLGRIAPSDANVLFTGESGVGKEVLANLVHAQSGRAGNAMVKLNCAAFPAHMIEGELFGYVKGAFTGALNDFPGLIEAAVGGTLFLDEIAEMPVELQTRFLRVLQEREYRQLGSVKTRRADFRLVAATNRDPLRAIEEGRFRADLFYRINTFTIEIPPLRERLEDIPVLAEKFVRSFAERLGKPTPAIAPEAMEILMRHAWPGNVRELENAMEYGVVLSRDGAVTAGLLPPSVREPTIFSAASGREEMRRGVGGEPEGGWGRGATSVDLRIREKAAIVEALVRAGGNKREAARMLGIQRPTLYNKMKRLGIPLRGAGG